MADKRHRLYNELCNCGWTDKDIDLILGIKGKTGIKARDLLSKPLYKLSLAQLLSIAKALGRSFEYVVDCARFGGDDLINMNREVLEVWLKRLNSEPSYTDVRRNISWAIYRNFDVVKAIEEYMDNHPEKFFIKDKLNPYQYQISKEIERIHSEETSSSTNAT